MEKIYRLCFWRIAIFSLVSAEYSQGQVSLLSSLGCVPQGGTISVRDLLRSLSLLVTFGICTTGSEGKKLTLEFVNL